MSPPEQRVCALPPAGWSCSRPAGHGGPCAAREVEAPLEIALCLHCMNWWDDVGTNRTCPGDQTEDLDHPVALYTLASDATPGGGSRS